MTLINMKTEYKDLSYKIGRLIHALSPSNTDDKEDNEYDMAIQLEYMERYSVILLKRINARENKC